MLADRARMAAATSKFIALGADFDGANDYMTRGAGLTGAADGRNISFSFWIRPDNVTSKKLFWDNNNNYCAIYFTAGNQLTLDLKAPGGGSSYVMQANDALAEDSAWHHIAISATTDAAAGSKTYHYYVDGVSKAMTETDASAAFDIDMTQGDWGIGASIAGADKIDAGLAEFWCDFTSKVDFSDSATLQKFRSAAGKPVDLGGDGSTPTGSQPIIYFTIRDGGAAADFATNQGSGGDYSVTGALTLTADNPSD